MTPRRRRSLLATLPAAAVALAAAGCVTEGPRPAPPPQPLPAQPRGITPDRIVRAVGLPEDTDRNGYSDLIPVTVYLFATTHPAPLQVPGRFIFELRDDQNRTLARWSFDEAQTQAASRLFLVGPGYIFRLSLIDLGIDRLPVSEPRLFVTFIPREGPAVEPRVGTTILMGGR